MKVTPESYAKWRAAFEAEMAAKAKKEEDDRLKGLPPREREEAKRWALKPTGKLHPDVVWSVRAAVWLVAGALEPRQRAVAARASSTSVAGGQYVARVRKAADIDFHWSPSSCAGRQLFAANASLAASDATLGEGEESVDASQYERETPESDEEEEEGAGIARLHLSDDEN